MQIWQLWKKQNVKCSSSCDWFVEHSVTLPTWHAVHLNVSEAAIWGLFSRTGFLKMDDVNRHQIMQKMTIVCCMFHFECDEQRERSGLMAIFPDLLVSRHGEHKGDQKNGINEGGLMCHSLCNLCLLSTNTSVSHQMKTLPASYVNTSIAWSDMNINSNIFLWAQIDFLNIKSIKTIYNIWKHIENWWLSKQDLESQGSANPGIQQWKWSCLQFKAMKASRTESITSPTFESSWIVFFVNWTGDFLSLLLFLKTVKSLEKAHMNKVTSR